MKYHLGKNFCHFQGVEGYGEWVIPKHCLENFAEIRFEENLFMAPKDWDTYLTVCYGDYMTPPPENERLGRHSIVEIKINNDLKQS